MRAKISNRIILTVFAFIPIFCYVGGTATASRFALFALDVQIPVKQGQSMGEIRKNAIDKGIRQAVEEATYRLIPDQGIDIPYEAMEKNIFGKAKTFVPQYKILGEKRFPGIFNLSLQVTVDTVLLRKALLKTGVLKTETKGNSFTVPVNIEIRNLVDGKTFMELWKFFKQREDLAEGVRLISAHHGVFVFQLIPLQSMKEIVSQLLYHAPVSRGTFDVIEQKSNRLILSYRLQKTS